MGKAAIKGTDDLYLWENLLLLAISAPVSAQQREQGQISTTPTLISHTFCLLLCKTSFSWCQKRSEICMQCDGGAEQGMEQVEALQSRDVFSAQQDPPWQHSAPAAAPTASSPLSCHGTGPTIISLSALRSGPSPCTTSHLHFSLCFRQRSSPGLWTPFQGQLLLQAKPGTLLLPIAALLCCGERHGENNSAVSLEVNLDYSK